MAESITKTCRRGHPSTPENRCGNGSGRTRCRPCHADKSRTDYASDLPASRLRGAQANRKRRGPLRGYANARKAGCPNGHPYDAANTYMHKGIRQCRRCRTEHAKQHAYLLVGAGGTHTGTEWEALLDSYGRACLRCGTRDDITRDHVVPLSIGGTNDIGNIQPLCRSCNSSKRDTVVDYRKGWVSSPSR